MTEASHPTESRLAQMRERYLGRKITDSLSPAGNWLELTLESAEPGDITLSLRLKHEMTNPYGNIHGGMMSLLIDEAIGWAVVSLDAPQHYTSLNLNVDFLYAAAEGEKLLARSKIIRHGKKIVHAECAVYNEQGTLLAKSQSNLVVTGMTIKQQAAG
jgi:acyl-coenzyme A thioesterase 13